ncbi:MAG: GNAT family N-acetyltransferase [Pseudomonadota bacterium]
MTMKSQETTPDMHSDRLLLRRPKAEDFESYQRFYQDPEASHFYGGPLDKKRIWNRLASDIGHWELRGYGVWAVQASGYDRCVGVCGFAWPEGWPRPELTWWITSEARRKGIAFEASTLAIKWAQQHNRDLLQTHMKDENSAARGLAVKLGGVKIARELFPDGIERDIFEFPSVRQR